MTDYDRSLVAELIQEQAHPDHPPLAELPPSALVVGEAPDIETLTNATGCLE